MVSLKKIKTPHNLLHPERTTACRLMNPYFSPSFVLHPFKCTRLCTFRHHLEWPRSNCAKCHAFQLHRCQPSKGFIHLVANGENAHRWLHSFNTGLALKLTLSEWKSARLCLTCSFPSTTSGPTWAQWLGKSYHATVKAPCMRVCSVGRFFVLVLSSLLPLLPASGQSNNDSNTPHICTNNMITANLHYKCMEYMQIICNGVRDMCANDSCLPAPLLPSRTIMPARSSFPKLAFAHFLVLVWPVPHSACQRRHIMFGFCMITRTNEA